MIKKCIATVLLLTVTGICAGCGATKDTGAGQSNVQEITLVNEQQAQDSGQTNPAYTTQADLQNQNSVSNDSQKQDDGQNNVQTQNTNPAQVTVTPEDVKKMVLSRVSGATEKDLQIELDYEDGHYVYEGEILYGQTEYEFEIDANTGTFLEWSEEMR